MQRVSLVAIIILVLLPPLARADGSPDKRFPLFAALTGSPAPGLSPILLLSSTRARK